jgi:fructoselysine 6-phosphate deglycase
MMRRDIQDMVKTLIAKKEDVGGIQHVYFVACGGSLAAFYPTKYLLESESKTLAIGYYTSNEFVQSPPKRLGPNSLVIACSHQGNTPETVEAAKISHGRDASVIVFTYTEDAPLSEYGDETIIYEWGDTSNVAHQKYNIGLRIGFELLHQIEGYEHYEKALSAFENIHDIVVNAKTHVARRAQEFAEKYRHEKLIYVLSSGASYGVAYQESICILLEMQWIHSSSFHSGEFFHGPFEITDSETPFLLLMNEGRTRILDERGLNFLNRYGRKVEVIDSKELGINRLDDAIVEFFNPTLLSNTLDIYNRELANARKHPLTQRRYMWKVAY